MSYEPTDVAEKLAGFAEYWSPRVIARVNDYEVKVVKAAGDFAWHTHDHTDELFLVIKGTLRIQLPRGSVTLGPGQLFVVPRGVKHCPTADGEVSAMLMEPTGVAALGDASGASTTTA